jgi:hypothetical protein
MSRKNLKQKMDIFPWSIEHGVDDFGLRIWELANSLKPSRSENRDQLTAYCPKRPEPVEELNTYQKQKSPSTGPGYRWQSLDK